jgi:uncharacterized protein YabN with tetrapyrrole methylase and pyrophosphatase domain
MSYKSKANKSKGSLVVVGTGIAVGHITAEARAWIEKAEKVLYCVADAATERLVRRINPSAESLYVFYADDKRRIITYNQMVDRILECVREGSKVCVVFYGHPGIFVHPSHEAIRQARLEGYKATMLPAVSSLDCLFADLGIDPAAGCQLIEATDLLIRSRQVDPSAPVIVWQIGCVGDDGFNFKGYDGHNLPVLVEVLEKVYGPEHEVIIYEAAQYAVCEPVIRPAKLKELAQSNVGVTGISTLYIPPKRRNPVDASMLQRLGLGHVIEEKMRKLETCNTHEEMTPLT